MKKKQPPRPAAPACEIQRFLPERDRARIRAEYAAGQSRTPRMTYLDLALKWNCSIQTIHNIVKKEARVAA